MTNGVALHGEWDLSRKKELAALFARLTPDIPVVINLRGVDYADSSFLGSLAALKMKFKDVAITLLDPSPQLLRVLKIVNFDRLFNIVNGRRPD